MEQSNKAYFHSRTKHIYGHNQDRRGCNAINEAAMRTHTPRFPSTWGGNYDLNAESTQTYKLRFCKRHIQHSGRNISAFDLKTSQHVYHFHQISFIKLTLFIESKYNENLNIVSDWWEIG